MANLPKSDLYAFPLHMCVEEPAPNGGKSVTYWSTAGMTLRDYFAGEALAGMLADPDSDGDPASFGDRAYMYADAMLKARQG